MQALTIRCFATKYAVSPLCMPPRLDRGGDFRTQANVTRYTLRTKMLRKMYCFLQVILNDGTQRCPPASFTYILVAFDFSHDALMAADTWLGSRKKSAPDRAEITQKNKRARCPTLPGIQQTLMYKAFFRNQNKCGGSVSCVGLLLLSPVSYNSHANVARMLRMINYRVIGHPNRMSLVEAALR